MVRRAKSESRLWKAALKVLQAPLPILALTLLAAGLNLPWPLEPSARAALPFLVLPVVHWSAFRAPWLLPAPIVLAIGLLSDVVAETPLGYWPLLLLGVLASGRAMRHLTGSSAGLSATLAALPIYAGVAFALAMLVPASFTLAWPDPAPIVAGIGLGVIVEGVAILLRHLAVGGDDLHDVVADAGDR